MSPTPGQRSDTDTEPPARMPSWMRRPLAAPGRSKEVSGLLDELHLNTVCRSAKCPNRGECYAEGTATFLIMGDVCTRDCRFCAVEGGVPAPLDPGEPARVAEAAARMGLRHVVVTSVTRDDLPDGGAAHFAATVRALKTRLPDAAIEVLTSDFAGDVSAVDTVTGSAPDVFNHNIESVPRLYARVRPGADYARSLRVLARAAARGGTPTKSGLMVGLGERPDEVASALHDLRRVGVGMVTIGQYLSPGTANLPVQRFVDPGEFEAYARLAREIGFAAVTSAPFVRSSYHAGEMAEAAVAAGDAGGKAASR